MPKILSFNHIFLNKLTNYMRVAVVWFKAATLLRRYNRKSGYRKVQILSLSFFKRC